MNRRIKLIKIVAIFSFFLLAIAPLVAYASPARGYEISIYDSTPWIFWFMIILGFIGGTSIAIHQLATKAYQKSSVWVLGLSILLLTKLNVLLLPSIRGYSGWAGDHIIQIGSIKDILLYGHFASDNFYPITHILLSSLNTVTTMDNIIINLSTAAMSILFVLNIYLLSTVTLSNKGQQIIATLLACVTLLGGGYNIFLMPNGWSIFMLPMVFYLYFKKNALHYKILLILFIAIYPLYHPLSALILILSLIILEILRVRVPLIKNRKEKSTSQLITRPMSAAIMIGLVSFLFWTLSFQNFKINIHLLWHQITQGVESNPIAEIGGNLDRINIGNLDFIILLIEMYGATITLLLFSIVGMFIIFKNLKISDQEPIAYRFLGMSCLFLFTGGIYAAYLIGVPGLEALAGGRLLFYSEIVTPILAAPALFLMFNEKHRHHLLYPGIFVAVIVLASFTSAISVYPSPQTMQPNPQITEKTIQGMEWFIEEKNNTIGYAYILSPPAKFSDMILGTIEANEWSALNRDVQPIPDHFYYTEVGNAEGKPFGSRYMIITEFDRKTYTGVWKDTGRFDYNDFNGVHMDTSVSKIFTNGDLDTFMRIV